MEKDFHYYLVYSIAKMTGFADAEIIAHASQFVDDNNEASCLPEGRHKVFPPEIKVNGGSYHPIMTQSISLISLDPYVQKYVYVPFHFLPGDNDVPIKGKFNSLSTTPNSANARSLLEMALDAEDAYQIGIALHTFADTWSHQNFTGLREGWNSVYPWYKVWKSAVPNIGHAEAGHSPDEISAQWMDYRLDDTPINNKKRALSAAKAMYMALRTKSGQGPTWTDVRQSYAAIMNTRRYDDRISAINQLLVDNQCGDIPPYSPKAWPDEAIDRDASELALKPNYTETHWYKFHQAAKRQLAFVLDLIKEL